MRFPEDGGDFLRGVAEHIERFGEHHAGDAVGHADVRKGAELPGVEHLLQPEGIVHANGSFCGAFDLFQGDRLRGLQRKRLLEFRRRAKVSLVTDVADMVIRMSIFLW